MEEQTETTASQVADTVENAPATQTQSTTESSPQAKKGLWDIIKSWLPGKTEGQNQPQKPIPPYTGGKW